MTVEERAFKIVSKTSTIVEKKNYRIQLAKKNNFSKVLEKSLMLYYSTNHQHSALASTKGNLLIINFS